MKGMRLRTVCSDDEHSNGQPVKGCVQASGCLCLFLAGRNHHRICRLMKQFGAGGSLNDLDMRDEVLSRVCEQGRWAETWCTGSRLTFAISGAARPEK